MAEDLAADGVTPLWEDGPWNDPDEDPYFRGKDGDLRRIFGITIEWWAQMYVAQDGRCAGCKRRFRFHYQCPPGKPRPPHVDHDHDSGEIRGLLCGRCNGNLSQGLTRYALTPPARQLGPWIVPRKQRLYGAALDTKRAQRLRLAQEAAARELPSGPPPDHPRPSTGSEP